ncbi:hypothetical protein Srufu_024930 [Streptomyces libani subsp. rufus]|nr:hypothetical protein Srufu_024930 [Streptomyces libani subsp. rufus]
MQQGGIDREQHGEERRLLVGGQPPGRLELVGGQPAFDRGSPVARHGRAGAVERELERGQLAGEPPQPVGAQAVAARRTQQLLLPVHEVGIGGGRSGRRGRPR